MKQMKVVHLTLHRGCWSDFASVVHELNGPSALPAIQLTNVFLHDLPNRPDAIYDLWRPDIVQWIFDTCRKDLIEADVIVTSDTAPLARVLWTYRSQIKGKVIVWVCNRIDYFNHAPSVLFYKTYASELVKMSQDFH